MKIALGGGDFLMSEKFFQGREACAACGEGTRKGMTEAMRANFFGEAGLLREALEQELRSATAHRASTSAWKNKILRSRIVFNSPIFQKSL